jgi:hypothetical protein
MEVISGGSEGDSAVGGRSADDCGKPEEDACSFITMNSFFFGYERSKGGRTITVLPLLKILRGWMSLAYDLCRKNDSRTDGNESLRITES